MTTATHPQGGSLPDAIQSQIEQLSADGDALADQERYPDAIAAYLAAWDLLPEPKTDWEAATWLLTAIGDAHFLNEDYAAGADNLSTAMHCPGAIGNPFVHLRLGQCQFELGHLDRAADELVRAHMGAGADIFEDQDPKYLRFLQTRAKDIPGAKKPWQFWK